MKTKFLAHKLTEEEVESFISNPAHGLLIHGAKYSGKSFLAKYISCQLLRTQPGKLEIYPYYMFIDAKESAGIDDIRRLKQFLAHKTTGKGNIRRIAIISDADHLGHEAQNAMLKILEEPPADTCLIVTASDLSKLRSTVASRLSKIAVRGLSRGQVGDERLFNISRGLPAIIASLSSDEDEHPSLTSLNTAKFLLGKKRYQRLIEADRLSKDSTSELDGVLDNIDKILRAKLKIILKKDKSQTKDRDKILNLIRLVGKTRRQAAANANKKILLTRLFYRL